MGPWPKRHEERQRGRERGIGMEMGEEERDTRGEEWDAQDQKGRGEGGRELEKEKNNNWGWRSGWETTREAINGREKETARGVKVEEENRASIRCFSTLFLPNSRRCGHLSDTLSSRANVSSKNITVEDEKTDRGLVFKAYWLVFACLSRSESLHIPSVILSAGGQL